MNLITDITIKNIFMKTIMCRMLFVLMLSAGISGLSAGVKNGAEAPDFTLQSASGETVSLSDFKGKYVVLEWTYAGCPFVKKFYNVGAMQKFQQQGQEMGAVWLSIDSTNPDSGGYLNVAATQAYLKEKSVHSTYLMDTEGTVGKAYGAKRTPHCFIINPEGKVIYQGAVDSESSADSADIEGATNYVLEGLKEAMAGKPLTKSETRPYGCGVKY